MANLGGFTIALEEEDDEESIEERIVFFAFLRWDERVEDEEGTEGGGEEEDDGREVGGREEEDESEEDDAREEEDDDSTTEEEVFSSEGADDIGRDVDAVVSVLIKLGSEHNDDVESLDFLVLLGARKATIESRLSPDRLTLGDVSKYPGNVEFAGNFDAVKLDDDVDVNGHTHFAYFFSIRLYTLALSICDTVALVV